MALPSSGQISFSDLNVERGLSATAEADMATAGDDFAVSYATDGTDVLSMDEFYGLSYGGGSTVTLTVYMKDTATIKRHFILYAAVNAGPPVDVYNTNSGGLLTGTCTQKFTIDSGLAAGDTVTFSTSTTITMAGLTVNCPNVLGSNTTYTTVGLVTGANTVYLTVKSDTNV